MRRTAWIRLFAVAVVLLPAITGAALAQERSGNVFVQAEDTDGAPLPGVTVELSGQGAPQLMVTGPDGQARFLKLDPGRYRLEASLEGFSTFDYPNVTVNIARNTSIVVQLSAAIEEVIVVTAESPLLDERKLSAGTTISQIELEKIPTARDPWAILTQAAGVQVDGINVGGNRSGQQSSFRSAGQPPRENDFLVDGVQITSMYGGGSSTYYDFGQFEEIQLGIGGNDVTKTTGGVSVNLVTKRGTNELRGSTRFLITRGDGYFGALEQADTGFNESDLGPGQPPFIANKINNIQDIGIEAGGPVWRDRVWLWASWGQNDINKQEGGGGIDRTVLENVAVKLNAQFSASNSFVGSFNNGDKLKFGRGANPSWDSSATWNQRGPTGISKLEDTHVFGSNFFLSGQYSFIDGGFALIARGGSGPDQPAIPAAGGETNIDAGGFRTNNASGGNSRATEEFKLDGSYFFNTGGLSHELKFGGRTREASNEDAWSYPGRNIFHYEGNVAGVKNPALLASLGLPPSRVDDAGLVYAYRQGPITVITNYNSLWIQDTMAMGQWTFNAGFRYDDQDGENKAGTVDA
ncbi:MAG: TonB-dependent receptor, partial [Thermoanaerobaculia bacterium]